MQQVDQQNLKNENQASNEQAKSTSKGSKTYKSKQSIVQTKQAQTPPKATREGKLGPISARQTNLGQAPVQTKKKKEDEPPKKHKAIEGDTVYSICIKYGISQEDFKTWNSLKDNLLQAGQEYYVSNPKQETTDKTKEKKETPSKTTAEKIPIYYLVKSGDSVYSICAKYNISQDKFKEWNKLKGSAIKAGSSYIIGYSNNQDANKAEEKKDTDPANTPSYYVAKSGDSVYGICAKYNISQDKFKEWNKLKGNAIKAGSSYIIGYSNDATSTTTKETASVKKNETTASAEGEKALKKDITFTESRVASADFTIWPKGTIVGNTTDPAKVNIKYLLSLEDRFMQIDKSLLGSGFGNAKLRALIDKKAADLTKEDKALIKTHVTSTIKAIETFQTSTTYNAKGFATKKRRDNTSHYVLTDSTTKPDYTDKQVKQGDATYVMLRDLRWYTWKYKGNDEKMKTVTARNFRNSGETTYEEGIKFDGTQKPKDFDQAKFKQVGNLTDKQAKALKYASSHEGNFDALNTYDRGVISFGFIQFAGGDYGTFTLLMASIKHNQAATFKDKFQKYGIDVSYELDGNKQIKKNPRPLLIINTGKKTLKGVPAEKYIMRHPHYLGVFMQAGQDTKIKEEQIRLSVDGYATKTENTALGNSFKIEILKVSNGKDKKPTIKIGSKDIAAYKKTELYKTAKKEKRVSESDFGDKLSKLKIKEVITSERGLAGVYSLMVNSPKYTRAWFRGAILAIIKEEGLTTIAQVKAISAKKILEKVIVLIKASKTKKHEKTRRAGRIQRTLDSNTLKDTK